MAHWVAIAEGMFIPADVIRWQERVYAPKRRRGSKAQRIGERLVFAEVIEGPDSAGWVRLLVRDSQILLETAVRKPSLISRGTEIRRNKKTILKGDAQRLTWSDESARSIIASRYLGPQFR